MITEITIKGFKSIKALDKFKLNHINVLIGANGAGKSNFIGFFKLLKELRNGNLHTYSRKQGGANKLLHFGTNATSDIEIEITTNEINASSLYFSLIPTNDSGLMVDRFDLHLDSNPECDKYVVHYTGSLFEDITWRNTSLDSNKDVIDGFFNYQIYHIHDTSETARVKGLSSYNDNIVLRHNAENIAPYLKMLSQKYPKHYTEIVRTIQLVLPFFGGFVHRDEQYLALEWYQKDNPDIPFNAHTLSDGSLRFICLATLLLQPTEKMPRTILIDEPELGLHPTAIAILAEMAQAISSDVQVIIATQSAELLNYFSVADIVTVNNHGNGSQFSRLNEQDYLEWLEEYTIGELWLKNVISAGV